MKKLLLCAHFLALCLSLTGCTFSLVGIPTPLILPTLTSLPGSSTATSPHETPFPPVASMTQTLPGNVPETTAAAPPAATTTAPAATQAGTPDAIPSGPYGVILVPATDVLNIRSGPGLNHAVTGSFPATAINVMRTGPASMVDGVLWVQVQDPSGGTGWVNAAYLTEYFPPAAFCADPRVNTLIATLGNALENSDGELLGLLVSPLHGMTVHLWLHQDGISFDVDHARWIFDSTYAHYWGIHPASGLETTGSFHDAVLPGLLDVLHAPAPGYSQACNQVQAGGASYDVSWPQVYGNINYYSLYKPAPAGNELSWRTILVGVEYVNSQPYVFNLIQLGWEP